MVVKIDTDTQLQDLCHRLLWLRLESLGVTEIEWFTDPANLDISVGWWKGGRWHQARFSSGDSLRAPINPYGCSPIQDWLVWKVQVDER